MIPVFWNRSGRVGDDRSLTVAALKVAALNQISCEISGLEPIGTGLKPVTRGIPVNGAVGSHNANLSRWELFDFTA